MFVELGHFAMILAMALAAVQAFFGLAGGARNDERWMRTARAAVAGQVACIAIGVAGLIHAFVANDFSVLYVAQNSNSALPLFYRVAALWGAHEGSMVLWITILALWTAAFALRSGGLPSTFAARALGVLGIVSFGFLLFTLTTSNPFLRLIPPAADGRDLNPLLQDFAMAVHPPILYTGYVGFSVSFALASHSPSASIQAAVISSRVACARVSASAGERTYWSTRLNRASPQACCAKVALEASSPIRGVPLPSVARPTTTRFWRGSQPRRSTTSIRTAVAPRSTTA